MKSETCLSFTGKTQERKCLWAVEEGWFMLLMLPEKQYRYMLIRSYTVHIYSSVTSFHTLCGGRNMTITRTSVTLMTLRNSNMYWRQRIPKSKYWLGHQNVFTLVIGRNNDIREDQNHDYDPPPLSFCCVIFVPALSFNGFVYPFKV